MCKWEVKGMPRMTRKDTLWHQTFFTIKRVCFKGCDSNFEESIL